MKQENSSRSAHVGDIVVLEGHHVGDSHRTGEIVEVLGEAEREHYRVRWEDGRETIFYSRSSGATIKRPRKRRANARTASAAEAGEPDYEGSVLVHEP